MAWLIKNKASKTIRPQSGLAEFWYYFSDNKGAVIGLGFFVAVVLVAILAPLLAPHGFDQIYPDFIRKPPSWISGGSDQFLLGTDKAGRDIFSRLIYGARYSLLIGLVVVSISLAIGTIVGLIAGYFGGWIDTLITRIMDIILAFPSLLLALVAVAILGQGLGNAMIAIAFVFLPHFVRLVRAGVLEQKSKDYITASRLLGASNLRLMFVAILPNCLGPLIVQGTLNFSAAILDAAALGFLGLGAKPPIPEWGTMLADGRDVVTSMWWIVTFPGLAILLTVLAINLMGDGLRDALDPKMKKS